MARCARCLAAWNELPIETRQEMTPAEKRPYARAAVTTVDGVQVCTEHLDEELAKVRNRRKADS